MSLDSYRQKRDFSNTPEPLGVNAEADNQWRFVVQKHAASRLHYDLRLEFDGVLLSWAVPKGPSLDWSQKRLAIRVEDHPLDYLDFEGVIPSHQYGGGTVMVWDTGRWNPRGDAGEDIAAGGLKFELFGQKLQGGFMLKRIESKEKNQWLLIKEKDSAMRDVADFEVLQELPHSVLSERTMAEISAAKTSIFRRADLAPFMQVCFSDFKNAKAALPPEILRPCLPTATRVPPAGEDWIHEIKHDGYRMLAHLDQRHVRFQSRNGKDWTDKLPSLAALLSQLPCRQATLDGEVVMLDENGVSHFQSLQNRIGAGKDRELRFYVFDLLYLDGHSLMACSLRDRKQLLSRLLGGWNVGGRVELCEHLTGDGRVIFQQACQLGIEGIVSKRMDKRYAAGRYEFWLKTKCLQSQEFVVGGFTPPSGSKSGIGAVLLGCPTEEGILHFVGKVGTGFSEESLRHLHQQLQPLVVQKTPFKDLNRRAADKGTLWVTPQTIVEIEFGGWTGDGLIRFGSFKGIREDIQLEDLRRNLERTKPASPLTSAAVVSPQQDVRVEPALPIPAELEEVSLSSPSRLVYPDMGISKLGLATYYAQVGAMMLPYIAGRPLSLLRCPGGIAQTCFFQKRAPQGLSERVTRVELPTGEGVRTFLVVEDVVGLLSLVQFNAMEFHVSNASAATYDRPDVMIIDLDPDPSLPWQRVHSAAVRVRDWLRDAGFEGRVKTSGGCGVHVVTHLKSPVTWKELKIVSTQCARELAGKFPQRFTSNVSKAARRGRIYLDVLRNVRGACTIAAYSTRAKRNAPVSFPVAWEELGNLPSSDSLSLQGVMARLAKSGDAWRGSP